ncbi:MAG: alpha amylase C-terminal domain-containing protein, partial [Eubacteriales bacterium]|nr:alpha amylase C-terminal domain-containing protein [Eubacteriales bacterium]
LLFMGQEFGQEREWSEARELDWFLLSDEQNRGMKNYVAKLLELYRSHKCLYEIDNDWGGFEWINANDYERSIYTFLRKAPSSRKGLVFVLNMTPVKYEKYRVGVPVKGRYRLVLNSTEKQFGGFEDTPVPAAIRARSGLCDYREQYLEFDLPAYGGLVFEFNY